MLRHYWHRGRLELREATAVQCPACREPVPLSAPACARCGASMTVHAAIHATVDPPRQRWRRFLGSATPETKRLIQRIYFVLSAAVLWFLLAYVEEHQEGTWARHAALSTVYLAGLMLLAVWLVPRPLFLAIAWRTSRWIKLSLVLNYLSALTLLQLFIGEWWQRALILAGLLGVTWVAAFLFHRFVVPMVAATTETFMGGEAASFNSSTQQGRKVRLD
ncbi:MAG: hypothetical protein ACYDC1_19880 [Limisphaerales bacterium]